jgi:hypothetical protein
MSAKNQLWSKEMGRGRLRMREKCERERERERERESAIGRVSAGWD